LSSGTSTLTAARPIWARRGSITGAANGDVTRTPKGLRENIIPGRGGCPQTFEGPTVVADLGVGSAEGAGEAHGAIDIDSIEIVYEP
jgi:hypothetical protein